MIDGATLKLLAKQCPNYHELEMGRGFIRATFSVIPCKDCASCLATREEGKRIARHCGRVYGLVSPANSIVGEYCTCDHAKPPKQNFGGFQLTSENEEEIF